MEVGPIAILLSLVVSPFLRSACGHSSLFLPSSFVLVLYAWLNASFELAVAREQLGYSVL